MVKEIREELIKLARLKTTWSYSQLNNQLQIGLNFDDISQRNQMSDWLGEISQHEFDNGRPLLSALITHQGKDREQGDGFFKLCERLYGKPWKELKNNSDFEVNLIRDCYSYWKDDENYKRYKNEF